MAVETAPAPTAHDEWLDPRWRLTGAGMGLLCLVTVALMVTMGTRPATYGDLLDDVASGKVTEVQVIGAGANATPPGDRVELRWTVLSGALDQYAVVQVGDDRDHESAEEPVFVSSGDPRDTLRSLDQDVVITPGSSAGDPSFTVMEWRTPGPLALLAIATWLAVLLLIIGGPEPWRATRWAWGWAWLLAGPLGGAAYLLLGGPLGLLRPASPHRRLTGGWALLVVWFVFAGWRETHGW